MTFRCEEAGCPAECGTRKKPGCNDRMLWHGLFLFLVAMILFGLAVGARDLMTAARLKSGAAEPPPVAAAEVMELVGESADNAGQGLTSDLNGKPAVAANELVQVPQQR